MAKGETYYNHTISSDSTDIALENNGKNTETDVENKERPGTKTTSRRGRGSLNLSYPLATGPSQRTGDRLVIKCIQFKKPPMGGGASINIQNLLKKDSAGNVSVISRNAIREKKYTVNGFDVKSKVKFDFEVEDATTRHRKSQQIKYRIELPIPQDLSDSNSVTWGEDRANALELGALAAAGAIMGSNDLTTSTVQAAQAAVETFNAGIDFGSSINTETQGAIRAALSGAAIGALGSNITPQSVISRSTGQILNNNLELLFSGVNLRTFPYSITFSPRSSAEGEVVRKIIRQLKASMAPKAGDANGGAQGIFIKSPDVFQLKYLKDDTDHPFLNTFKICALTGMNVSYTNAGTYSTYENGVPVNIRMSLTFKELNPIYHEDYQTSAAGPGVGY